MEPIPAVYQPQRSECTEASETLQGKVLLGVKTTTVYYRENEDGHLSALEKN